MRINPPSAKRITLALALFAAFAPGLVSAQASKDQLHVRLIELQTQMQSLKGDAARQQQFAAAQAEFLQISDGLGGDVPCAVGPSSAGSSSPRVAPTAPTNCTPASATFTQATAVAVPTGPAVVTSTLAVSGAGTYLWDVDVTTFLRHTFNADVDMTITSPAGTVVTLTTDNGGGNDDVFNGTVWDDDANPLGQVPYTSNNGLVTDHVYANLTLASPLVPEEALSAFVGENPNGTWTITISDDLAGDGGSLDSWSLNLTTFAAAPILNAVQSFNQTTAVAIPTGPAVVTSTLAVAGTTNPICKVALRTTMPHTFAADLDVTLTSPSGTVVTLTTDNGGGNDNVFAGTTWDDDANPAGQVPYVTNDGVTTDHLYVNLTTATPLVAEESLGALMGESANGTWTLTVSDDAAGDSGSIDAWGLDFTTCSCALPAEITLAATVGTAPGVCAATDAVTVSSGTEVYYCYVATNTGGVALNFHDLSDTVSGVIVNDLPFVLAPGASSPQVIVPSTPTATLTNTATWTAATGTTYTVNTAAPFGYIPINATGTALNLTDDSEANIVSPFPITYFGVTSNNLRVGNNGGILFNATAGDIAFTNAALPNAAHPLAIFPYWDDFFDTTGNVYWQVQGAAPNRQLIVEWFQRSHFDFPGNTATFQVVISEGSNQIRFQYLDVDLGNVAVNNGASATVGLNVNGTTAQQVSFNTASIANNQAISFTAPQTASATDSTTVTVLIPNIDVTPASLTATAPVNQTTTAPLSIANTGLGTLNWNITEEPVGQPQSTPGGRGSAIDARDEASDVANKPGAPDAVVPVTGPIWRAPAAVLFDNGPLVTNPGAGAGGADASALQLTQNSFGFGHAVTTGFRMADDFVVGGSGWLINTVTFFAYQTGSTTTSTINAVNVRIWNGPPGAPGSTVVFGDTTTNRLASSTFTNIFRTASTPLTGTTRPIMANTVTINTFLPAGTYWFDWQTGGTLGSGPWAPAVTLVGQQAKPGSNGLQFDPTAMTWGPANDSGPPIAQQDLPFVIDGLADCANPSDVPWLSLSPTNGSNAAGTNTVVTASFNATGLAAGNYSARLCVTSNDPTPGPGNGTGLVIVPVTFAVTASADLVMTLTDAPDPVTAGTNLTYTATVTNTGPSAANNVSFTLPLPANTSFVSATPSAGGSCAGNPVVCTWAGSTAAGASNSATITVLVAPSVLQGASLSATATATSATFDPNLVNNAATTTTAVVASADLQATLAASATAAPINVPVTFTANSLNLGPSDAQGVSITVTLTPDFRYSSHTATGATCTVPQVGTTGAIVCTWAGATAPGVTRTLTVVAFSNVEGRTAVNASTTSATTDPTPANNAAGVNVVIGYLIEEIPTLGNLGLLLMALMMGLMGFVAVRRQS